MGIQLSKDDEGTTSIFIAEATLNRISSDGIGSLMSFSVPSFRVPLCQEPVPLVHELQLPCNFQPGFYRVSVLKLSCWIPRHYGVAWSCMFVSSLLSKFWNLSYRGALNLAVTSDVRCVLINKRSILSSSPSNHQHEISHENTCGPLKFWKMIRSAWTRIY